MSDTPLEMDIIIPCSSEFVSIIRLAISGVAARMNFAIEDIEDIKISVSEACTNAIQHAYPDNTGKDNKIHIKARMHQEELEIEVKDNGKGFDLGILGTTAQKKASEEKMGLGLGITFIKNLMDHAEFSSNDGEGTTVRMFKKSPASFQ
jgi:serine/threonine-protein kinase RsbW